MHPKHGGVKGKKKAENVDAFSAQD